MKTSLYRGKPWFANLRFDERAGAAPTAEDESGNQRPGFVFEFVVGFGQMSAPP